MEILWKVSEEELKEILSSNSAKCAFQDNVPLLFSMGIGGSKVRLALLQDGEAEVAECQLLLSESKSTLESLVNTVKAERTNGGQ